MHVLRAPPKKLSKKDSKWHWSTECQSAFEEIKRILASKLSLTHYELKNIIVASDTTNLGLRAIICHKKSNGQVKAVAHAQRRLLPTEKGYSQIEKKSFRIKFCGKKFYRFIYAPNGQPTVTVFSKKKKKKEDLYAYCKSPSEMGNNTVKW